jgi:hypothetical protein
MLRAYYVRNGNLLPDSLGPEERRQRSRRNPDLRLILTRTRRIPFHIAARHQHTDVLEYLDPSIPLSFLLSGSAEDSAEGSALPAVGHLPAHTHACTLFHTPFHPVATGGWACPA